MYIVEQQQLFRYDDEFSGRWSGNCEGVFICLKEFKSID